MKTTNKTRALNILIPNATSPRNVGDQAMLEVLIDLVRSVHKNALITVHSTDPSLYKKYRFNTKHTIYSWSVFNNENAFPRITNIMKLMLQYFLLQVGSRSIIVDKELTKIVNDYKNADLILFVGGGYLRSRAGLKQSLNLFMQLLIFKYAKLFPARKIVAPISIGPFGYKWLEKVVVNDLRQMDLVAAREEYSYKILKKFKMKNIVLSSDHAFMTKNINKKKNAHKITIGFTIREWLKGDKHTNFERFFAEAIQEFSQLTGARVQPIVQVDASKYGEDDALITKRIIARMKNKNIDVLKTKAIQGVRDALDVYSAIDLLLGMRMHSNILAAVQGTPFVAISYEHKTEGIARQLAMEKYCVKCEEVNKEKLYKLLVDVYTNKVDLKNKLMRSVKVIQINESQKWNKFLSHNRIV